MSSKDDQNRFVTRERTNKNLLDYARQNRNSATYNDVIIIAQNQRIFANKLVLGCFCPYFEEKLNNAEKDSYVTEMEMLVYDVDTLRLIIDYFYTGTISINDHNVSSILEQAHLFKLNEVMQFCFDYLKKGINCENCITVRGQAKLYSNSSLECVATNFINNNFQHVINTSSFKQLNKPDLHDCLLDSTEASIPASIVYEAAVSWTKYDVESRSKCFHELLNLIDFEQLSLDFMQRSVASEELVQNDLVCMKLVFKYLRTAYDRHKEEIVSALISIGGRRTPKTVLEIDIGHNKKPTKLPDLPIPLSTHITLLLDDRIYCVGGVIENNDDKIEINDNVWEMILNEPDLKWNEVASMNDKRHVMGAAIFKNCLLVAGGGDDKNNDLSSSEVFIPQLNVWQYITAMNQARSGNALVECKNKLYVIGGWGGGSCLSSVECISDLKAKWKYIASMNEPRRWLAAVNCNDVIYAIGGKSGDGHDKTMKSVEKYDPETDEWSFVSNMTIKRSSHSAAVMDGKIYVVGGIDTESEIVRIIECYDPSNDSWSVVGETPNDLYHNSLVVL